MGGSGSTVKVGSRVGGTGEWGLSPRGGPVGEKRHRFTYRGGLTFETFPSDIVYVVSREVDSPNVIDERFIT